MQKKKFKPSMIPIYVILAIAIITVAFLIVGGAYLWHFSLITKIDTLEHNQAALQQEIKKMQPDAEDMDEEADESEDMDEQTDEDNQAPRVLLEPRLLKDSNVYQYNPTYDPELKASEMDCEMPKQAKAHKVKKYFSKKTGSSFELPYNEEWMDERYELNPYDVVDPYDPEKRGILDQVYFGPMSPAGNCAWARQYVLSFVDYRGLEDILEKYKNYRYVKEMKIKTEQGELTAVKVMEEGVCGDVPVMIIIGPEYDYEFSGSCWTDTSDDFDLFEEIVESFYFTHGL